MFSPDAFLSLLLGEHATGGAAEPTRAVVASRIAASKHVMETPLLRALGQDTQDNFALHARIRAALAHYKWTADQLVEWIYRELFAMPLDDATLGLVVAGFSG
jgi:hypothetical protein